MAQNSPSNRHFTIGALVGLPVAVYAVQQLVNLIAGQPVVVPPPETVAVIGFLVAGTIATVAAKYRPGWLVAIESGEVVVEEPAAPPAVTQP
jgi:hypothetical protein